MVKIKKINIISFGGLKNVNLELNDGLNVIYGENEAGKSTVQAFIKIMLYGMPRKKKTDAFNDRVRFSPWDGGNMSGSLIVEYDGKDIEIFRKFGKTAAGDKTEVIDCISGEKVPGFDNSNVGEKLFNMSLSMFEKTMWIGQGSAAISGTDEEIASKLMNLAQTHDEDVSHIRTIEELNKKKADLKAESKRNKNGVIDDIDIRTEELLNLKRQLADRKNERLELERIKEELIRNQTDKKQSLKNVEKAIQAERDFEKIHKADKLKEYLSLIKSIKNSDDYIRFEGCNAAELEAAEKYYAEKDSIISEISKYEELEDSVNDDNSIFALKGQHNRLRTVSFFITAIGVIAAAALMLISTPIISLAVGIAFISAGIAIFCLSVSKKKSYMEKIEKMQMLKAEYDNNLKMLRQRLKELDAKTKAIYEKRQINDISEYRSLYNKYTSAYAKLEAFNSAFESLLNGENYEELIKETEVLRENLKDVDLSEYKAIDAEDIRGELFKLERQLSDIDNKLNYEYSESVSETDIDNELLTLENKRKSAVFEYNAVEIALSCIEEAYSRLRSEFGPALNKKVNETVEFLTDGKYSDFRVSDSYRMKINCMGETKDAEYLSGGTYEQIYLALRLGILGLVLEDSKIMFLDDAFSAYDDKRAKRAIELIKNSFEDSQAILFSCHVRDRDNAAAPVGDGRRVRTATLLPATAVALPCSPVGGSDGGRVRTATLLP